LTNSLREGSISGGISRAEPGRALDWLFRREQGLPASVVVGIVPQLTPIAVACLATVVGTAAGTFTLAVLCLFVAWGRSAACEVRE